MTRLERALRILEEEFDAFFIIGSMYDPASGQTGATKVNHGNAYTIEAMIQEVCEEQFMPTNEEQYDGEEERDC